MKKENPQPSPQVKHAVKQAATLLLACLYIPVVVIGTARRITRKK